MWQWLDWAGFRAGRIGHRVTEGQRIDWHEPAGLRLWVTLRSLSPE
jgi:hypothetical protein